MSHPGYFSVTDRQSKPASALSYIDSGPDENAKGVLVFLHGLMMSKEVWEHQINYFSGEYRIIVIDLAGFGESSNTALRNSYAEHAHDVHRLLKNNLITDVHLIGWSMGASIAINFAELFPSILNTLTLVDACPKGRKSTDFPWGVDNDTVNAIVKLFRSEPELAAEKFTAQVLSGPIDKTLYAKVLNIVRNTRPEVAIGHIQFGIRSDLRGMLHNIQAPTLLINGELDTFSPTQVNRYMAQQIMNVHWVELPEAGHAPFLTMADEFNLCLKRFLENANSRKI